MKTVVLHAEVGPGASPDAADTLIQAEAVAAALRRLGHDVHVLAMSLNLGRAAADLRALAPDRVFNLVEEVDRAGRLIAFGPMLLDHLGIPYTGAPADTMYLTSNKLLAKSVMRFADVPTPEWHAGNALDDDRSITPGLFVIKSVWEHASIGLDEGSVIEADSAATLRAACQARCERLGGQCFAEAYIEGREFNLSLLAGDGEPVVLPPGEIIFKGYGSKRRHVVGYRAKWDAGSFEYRNTPRRFQFRARDRRLIATVTDVARRCWRLFGVRGYARVDFRVDAAGVPWVLEVNANPCLAPDAGYAAALDEARIPYDEAVGRILADVSVRANPPGVP